MTTGPAPSVERRRLRTILRRKRDAQGLTQEQVATAMDWSLSKVIRIESGSVSITTNDLRALLDLYGVLEKDPLLELARAARRAPWWTPYRDDYSSDFIYYIGLEASASYLRYFHATLVPGLVQTSDYARKAVAATGLQQLSEEQISRRLDFRRRRQEEFFQQPRPPRLEIVLDEAIIRRMVDDVPMMRGQIDHLIELNQPDRVTIQVIPFSCGLHPGYTGPFAVLDFDDPDVKPVLYLEGAQDDQTIRERPDELSIYRSTFQRLQSMALSPDETSDFLRRAAAELD